MANIFEYQRPLGKIEDISELRLKFIEVYQIKSKKEMARFGLILVNHLQELTGFSYDEEILQAINAVQRWIDDETSYHEARNIDISSLARNEKNSIKVKYYRAMQQIACIPHVKYHGLFATDFIIVIVNNLYPGDMEKVRQERECQIALLKSIV